MKTSRKLRSTGLALLAFCAVAALGPAQSQAGQFTAAEFPATITGQNVGVHLLETELGVMECEVTFHGVLPEASPTLTITPTYGTGCSIAGIEVHVTNNGCDFLFHAGNTLGEEAVAGAMDVKCPDNAVMDFEITSMMACHLTIPEQNGLGPITYTNRTMAKDVDLDFNVEGLIYQLDAGCPVMGNFNNGTYSGVSTLKADHGGMGTAFKVD